MKPVSSSAGLGDYYGLQSSSESSCFIWWIFVAVEFEMLDSVILVKDAEPRVLVGRIRSSADVKLGDIAEVFGRSNSTRWPDFHVRQFRLSSLVVPIWNEIEDASVFGVLMRIHQPFLAAWARAEEAPTLTKAPKELLLLLD